MKANYPEDFFSFKDGFQISDEEINEWIDKCIRKLKEDPEIQRYSISSGNAMVEVHRMDKYEDGFEYEITVSKDYETKAI